MDRKEVLGIAKLARLKFEDKELDSIEKDMGQIIDWIDILQQADVSSLDENGTDCEIGLRVREDTVKISGLSKELMKNAKEPYESFFTVPKVVD